MIKNYAFRTSLVLVLFWAVIGVRSVSANPGDFVDIPDPLTMPEASTYDTVFYNNRTVVYFNAEAYTVTRGTSGGSELYYIDIKSGYTNVEGYVYIACDNSPDRNDCYEVGNFENTGIDIYQTDPDVEADFPTDFHSSNPNYDYFNDNSSSLVDVPNPITDPSGFVSAVLHNTGITVASWFVPFGSSLTDITVAFEDLKTTAFSVVPFAYFAMVVDKIPGDSITSEATTLFVTVPIPGGGTFELPVFDNSQSQLTEYIALLRTVIEAAIWLFFVGYLYERVIKHEY